MHSPTVTDETLAEAVTKCVKTRTHHGLPLVAELRMYVEAEWHALQRERNADASLLPPPVDAPIRKDNMARIRELVKGHATRGKALYRLHARMVSVAGNAGHKLPAPSDGLTNQGGEWVRTEYQRAREYSRKYPTLEGFEIGTPPVPEDTSDPLFGRRMEEIVPPWDMADERNLLTQFPHLENRGVKRERETEERAMKRARLEAAA